MREPHFLRGINDYDLDPGLLAGAAESIAQMRAGEGGFDDYMDGLALFVSAAGLQGDEVGTACTSILFRLSALNRFLKGKWGVGFRAAGEGTGYHYLDHAVYFCGAKLPLLEEDGPVSFDEEHLSVCILTNTRVAGRT